VPPSIGSCYQKLRCKHTVAFLRFVHPSVSSVLAQEIFSLPSAHLCLTEISHQHLSFVSYTSKFIAEYLQVSTIHVYSLPKIQFLLKKSFMTPHHWNECRNPCRLYLIDLRSRSLQGFFLMFAPIPLCFYNFRISKCQHFLQWFQPCSWMGTLNILDGSLIK